MKLGIIGLPGAGKKTIFDALTRNVSPASHRGAERIGTIRVPDERIDALSKMYAPQKTIYARVEYLLPGTAGHKQEASADQSLWTAVRDCDALIHVIRNFGGHGQGQPAPVADFLKIDQELMLADLMVVEKRLERMKLDARRGKKPAGEEHALLTRCRQCLEAERPLRQDPDLAHARPLRGFAFLSAKPMLVLLNNEDDDDSLPEGLAPDIKQDALVIRGKLEQELAQMSEAEAAEFLSEFNIRASAMDRVIKRSYELLGLISFFTVGKDEVRAWTIKRRTAAVEAAGVIHSDMKKGFIRAEVLSYHDLMAAGSYGAARKKGTVRLEGKTYRVQDGDIINFRFNV